VVILLVLLAILILVSSITDLKYNTIYNWVTLPGVILGLLLNTWFFGFEGLKLSLAGLGIGFGALLPFFIFGGIGGGDIKLLAAIGALKGYPFILYALFYGILVGGIFALFVMVKHGVLQRSLKNIFLRIFRLVVSGHKNVPLKKEESYTVPYGVAISLGTVWAFIMVEFF
jgi:prepilin peptidase CpaA